MKFTSTLATLITIIGLSACQTAPNSSIQTLSENNANRFFIGQDLGAIRGYMAAACCVDPTGATMYVDLYDLSSSQANYGGLGLDLKGNPVGSEQGWDSGPVGAYKAATEFGIADIAIGLSMTENKHPGALDRLVAGKYDDNIRRIAELADHVKGKLYLRVAYEFEGMWNEGYDNAPRYIKAWRRVVDILRETDADNIIYVWQGAASTTDNVIEQGKFEDIRDWYPGDDYVDWVGISWFMNPDESVSIPLDFDVPTARILADEIVDFARLRKKPVLIAEAAPQGFDIKNLTERHHAAVWDGPAGTGKKNVSAQYIWDYWFQPMFDYMNDNEDVIKGLAYINVNWDSQVMWGPPYESGYWGDTRVEVNEEITRRWNTAMSAWMNK